MLFLLSQLRETREPDAATELAEQNSDNCRKDDPAKAATEIVAGLRLLRLRLHDVHGLCGDLIVLIFGHDCFLLVGFEFVLSLFEVKAVMPPPRLNLFYVQTEIGNAISSCSSSEQSLSFIALG